MDPLTLIVTAVGSAAALVGAIYAGVGFHSRRKKRRLASELAGDDHDIEPALTSSVVDQSSQLGATALVSYEKWVDDETSYIDVRGIKVGTTAARAAMRIRVLDLYTELYVQRGPTNWESDEFGSDQRIALSTLLKKTRCLVVTGDPGSGKTTFLRYIANKATKDLQAKHPMFIELPEFYRFVVLHKQQAGGSASKELGTGDPNAWILLDYMMDLGRRESFDISRPELLAAIGKGDCMWLLDSLDELPSAQARETVVDILMSASRRWEKCDFVLTSRPLALTGKSVPVGFEVVSIDALQHTEIRVFVEKWFAFLYPEPGAQEGKRLANELFSNIIENPQLRALARNPVMLTCMAVLHYNNRHLPDSKADLLEAVIQWLIRSREGLERPDRETPEFVEARLRELALSGFEQERDIRNRVGRQWASERIKASFNDDANAAIVFLEREENQTGILVRRGEGDIAFWHSWFQQYLAAKEIAAKTDDETIGWWSKIEGHIDDPDWREVIVLVPMCLLRLGSDRVHLFLERISRASCDEDFARKVRTVGFVGKILRDLVVLGYQPAQASSWKKLLEDVRPIFVHNLTDVPLADRFDAAIAYGLSRDETLEKEHTAWVTITGDVFMMGAQSSDLRSPSYDEYAALWECPVIEMKVGYFDIKKYPVTVREYETFVRDKGYQQRQFWTDEGWKWKTDRSVTLPNSWDVQLLQPNCPVTSVSWYEAEAYCRWLTKTMGREDIVCRLPSEGEWEYAARRQIVDGRRFPWGNTIREGEQAECNWGGCGLRKKSPVGMFPDSNTHDGLSDMYGNVEEWCADDFAISNEGYSQFARPRVIAGEKRKVVRGGSTIRYMRLCRPTYRSRTLCNERYPTIGFRPIRQSRTTLEQNNAAPEGEESAEKTPTSLTADFDRIANNYVSSLETLPSQYLDLIKSEFSLKKEDRLIDLGCGAGLLTKELRKLSDNVEGIDCSTEMSRMARETDSGQTIRWICGYVEDFEFDVDAYKLIMSYESFHLFQQQDKLIKKCYLGLKTGGYLCVGWCDYFWEEALQPAIVEAYRLHGIDWGEWGYQRCSKFLRLVEESSLPFGRSRTVMTKVKRRQRVSSIAAYLANLSKSAQLGTDTRRKIEEDMVEAFTGITTDEEISGETSYWLTYITKSA